MIEIIIKSYFSMFIAIGLSCASIFFLGLFLIFKKSSRDAVSTIINAHNENYEDDLLDSDLSAIAGDDLPSTQLDLARAFIEADKKQLAQKILENIINDGNPSHQEEARLLLGQI
jgi:FimV-like protein